MRLPGPLGCLAALVLLPVAAVSALGMLLFMSRSARKVARQAPAPRTPEEAEREIALCSLVRNLSLDGVVTREEALSQTIIGTARGDPVSDLLAEAVRRGWVEEADGNVRATRSGAERAAERLRRAGLA